MKSLNQIILMSGVIVGTLTPAFAGMDDGDYDAVTQCYIIGMRLPKIDQVLAELQKDPTKNAEQIRQRQKEKERFSKLQPACEMNLRNGVGDSMALVNDEAMRAAHSGSVSGVTKDAVAHRTALCVQLDHIRTTDKNLDPTDKKLLLKVTTSDPLACKSPARAEEPIFEGDVYEHMKAVAQQLGKSEGLADGFMAAIKAGSPAAAAAPAAGSTAPGAGSGSGASAGQAFKDLQEQNTAMKKQLQAAQASGQATAQQLKALSDKLDASTKELADSTTRAQEKTPERICQDKVNQAGADLGRYGQLKDDLAPEVSKLYSKIQIYCGDGCNSAPLQDQQTPKDMALERLKDWFDGASIYDVTTYGFLDWYVVANPSIKFDEEIPAGYVDALYLSGDTLLFWRLEETKLTKLKVGSIDEYLRVDNGNSARFCSDNASRMDDRSGDCHEISDLVEHIGIDLQKQDYIDFKSRKEELNGYQKHYDQATEDAKSKCGAADDNAAH